jgi:hypothetical protein
MDPSAAAGSTVVAGRGYVSYQHTDEDDVLSGDGLGTPFADHVEVHEDGIALRNIAHLSPLNEGFCPYPPANDVTRSPAAFHLHVHAVSALPQEVGTSPSRCSLRRVGR